MDQETETYLSPSFLQKVSAFLGGLIIGLIVLAVVGALVAGIVIVAKLAAAGRISGDADPLKTIFASRLMVAVARITILFIALYLIVSILVLVGRGQFLSEVGPIKFSKALRKSDAVTEELSETLNEAIDENFRLEEEVLELRSQLESTNEYLASVLQETGNLSDTGEDDGSDTTGD